MSKTILVTGSSSGFGKLIVETEAAAGNTVFATMRNVNGSNAERATAIQNWAAENNYDVHVVELDVTDETSVANAVTEVFSKTDRLDVLVNNAGVFTMGIGETHTVEDYQKVFDVNVYGVVRVTNAFLPKLREQRNGLIITVSSVMGRIVLPFTPVYTSSKWAAEAIAEAYRYELALEGIDSVIIEPGAFPTEIFGKVSQPSKPEVLETYGPTKEAWEGFTGSLGQMFEGEVVPNPQAIADATRTLIDTPAGERPLRTIVDQLYDGYGVPPMNELTDSVQKEVFTGMGMDAVLHVAPETVA